MFSGMSQKSVGIHETKRNEYKYHTINIQKDILRFLKSSTYKSRLSFNN